MTRGSLAIVGLVLLIVASGAAAHEIRPAYLQISETHGARFDVLWKVPQRGEMVLGLHVEWPETCKSGAPLLHQALATP